MERGPIGNIELNQNQHSGDTMDYECFAVEISDNIAHVILNRPDKRNAMNKAFLASFRKSLRTLTRTPEPALS